MKKEVVLFGILFLIFAIGFSSALTSEQLVKVDKAYSCLEGKIDSQTCSKLTIDQMIFSFLATGKCEKELIAKAQPNGCYAGTNGQCSVELTAKAGIAFQEFGIDNDLQQEWLLSQQGVSKDLIWYLQIDGTQEMNCKIASLGDTTEVTIGEDKKISIDKVGASRCFSLAQSNYWLEINENCYDKEFLITCEADDTTKNFLTTLLFREQSSQTIHVSTITNSAPIRGTSSEKINSLCFNGATGACDYSGSLWASVFIDLKEKGSAKNILPYLITGIGRNFESFPSVFLYYLTGDLKYRTEILRYQTRNGNWARGTEKYYPTALALFPFVSQVTDFKNKAQEWLLGPTIQQTDGCWESGNIIDNSFLLYTAFTRDHPEPLVSLCEQADYSCVGDESICSAINGADSVDLSCENSEGNFCCDIPEENDCRIAGKDFSCCDPLTETCEGEINSSFVCGGKDKCFYQEPNPCLDIGENYTCVANASSCDGGLVNSLSCLGNDVCCYSDWTEGTKFCEDEGFECVANETLCTNDIGIILNEFECGLGGSVCCGIPSVEEDLCDEIDGYSCISEDEECAGGITTVGECSSGEVCCKTEPPISGNGCVDAGYQCTSNALCANSGLWGYDCSVPSICCDELIEEPTCYESLGDICNTAIESCKNGNILYTSDLRYDEICCVSGTCEENSESTSSECKTNGGNCYSSCTSTEEEVSYSCSNSGDVCCVSKKDQPTTNYWWVWVLFLLIILVVVGILYRDKLKDLIQKIQSKKGGKRDSREVSFRRGPPGMPPQYERRPQTMPAPRTIIPQQNPIQRRTPVQRKKSPAELDEVLKKLKEIGK